MATVIEKSRIPVEKPTRKHDVAFAGRRALISAMTEDIVGRGCPIQRLSDTLLVTGSSNEQAARALSQILGTSVSIVSDNGIEQSIGQDEADRYIARVEAKRKSR
ncbi:hypothetical protein L0Y65_07200 [Candidatus Micrarchaeota archaeon]|nr:hypothetical protein [Candidatus Micrarchaeota archaeon]